MFLPSETCFSRYLHLRYTNLKRFRYQWVKRFVKEVKKLVARHKGEEGVSNFDRGDVGVHALKIEHRENTEKVLKSFGLSTERRYGFIFHLKKAGKYQVFVGFQPDGSTAPDSDDTAPDSDDKATDSDGSGVEFCNVGAFIEYYRVERNRPY